MFVGATDGGRNVSKAGTAGRDGGLKRAGRIGGDRIREIDTKPSCLGKAESAGEGRKSSGQALRALPVPAPDHVSAENERDFRELPPSGEPARPVSCQPPCTTTGRIASENIFYRSLEIFGKNIGLVAGDDFQAFSEVRKASVPFFSPLRQE